MSKFARWLTGATAALMSVILFSTAGIFTKSDVADALCAILLALLNLHEVPGVNTLIGGSIILAAVLFHHMQTHTRRR